MEKLLRKIIDSSGVKYAIQCVGPKLLARYGPKLGKATNEQIRQYLPWWPF